MPASNTDPTPPNPLLDAPANTPEHVALALRLNLPQDPHSLTQFNNCLSLFAARSAAQSVQHLIRIAETGKPETSRRACMSILHFANQLPKSSRKSIPAPTLNTALLFLHEALTTGPLPAADLIAFAQSKGISPKTLRRAKTLLKLLSHRAHSHWLWSLPKP